MPEPHQHFHLDKWLGYLAVPHELLHLVGYRLVGRRCIYHWGQSYVTPLEPMPRHHRLVGLLFPCFVFAILLLVCGILSGLAYLQGQPLSFLFWLIGGQLAAVYLSTTIGDLRKAYLLIKDQPWQSWTPLDIFYWPFVDWAELRRQASTKSNEE